MKARLTKMDFSDWGPAREDILRREWTKGTTAARIAALLGRTTRNAVVGKARRLGLPGRASPIKRSSPAKKMQPGTTRKKRGPKLTFWTQERIAILKAGYAPRTMLSISAIAANLDCNEWRIFQGAKMLGLVHPMRGQRGDGRAGGTLHAAYGANSDKIMKARLAAKEPVTAPDSRNVSLADLTQHQCHFPTSPHMVAPGGHRFCGAEVERNPDGTAQRYCAFHHAVATRSVVSEEERAADNGAARMAAE